MNEGRSARNKTIDFTLEEGQEYLDRCVQPENGMNGIINGDCIEVMGRLPRNTYRLLIADPPYNMDKDFGGSPFRHMSDEAYERFTERWIIAALPCLTADASVYVCSDWECSSAVERVLRRHFTVRNRITWQREKGRGALRNWKNAAEDIWFATRSDDYIFNVDAVKNRRRVNAPYRADGVPKDWDAESGLRDTYPSNFWDDITVPFWSMNENTAHPTQKSEKLLARLVLAGSAPGDAVLDPFAGSGSTPAVCRKLGRNFTGIEISPLYCAWAQKRLEDAAAVKTIQGYSDGVFWDRNTGK